MNQQKKKNKWLFWRFPENIPTKANLNLPKLGMGLIMAGFFSIMVADADSGYIFFFTIVIGLLFFVLA